MVLGSLSMFELIDSKQFISQKYESIVFPYMEVIAMVAMVKSHGNFCA